jgi:hypothetical protein
VVAIEPSDVMAAQRPPHLAPAIRASAGDLPLRDGAVDAALAILTLHHRDDERERGVRERRQHRDGPDPARHARLDPRLVPGHPERALDPVARANTSGFARMPPAVVERVVGDPRRDLDDGTWDARHGQLRRLESYDAGMRLIVAT